MQTSIKIRKEHPPTRCLVCHQSDLFDPESGECGRCSELQVVRCLHCGHSVPVGIATGICPKCRKTTSDQSFTIGNSRPSEIETLVILSLNSILALVFFCLFFFASNYKPSHFTTSALFATISISGWYEYFSSKKGKTDKSTVCLIQMIGYSVFAFLGMYDDLYPAWVHWSMWALPLLAFVFWVMELIKRKKPSPQTENPLPTNESSR